MQWRSWILTQWQRKASYNGNMGTNKISMVFAYGLAINSSRTLVVGGGLRRQPIFKLSVYEYSIRFSPGIILPTIVNLLTSGSGKRWEYYLKKKHWLFNLWYLHYDSTIWDLSNCVKFASGLISSRVDMISKIFIGGDLAIITLWNMRSTKFWIIQKMSCSVQHVP